MSDPFRRVRVPCSSWWCSRTVQTLAYVPHPRCHACRARLRNLAKGRARTVRAARRRYLAAIRRMEAR